MRIIREQQALPQMQLAELCGIAQTTISGIETGRINLRVERAKTLAIAQSKTSTPAGVGVCFL